MLQKSILKSIFIFALIAVVFSWDKQEVTNENSKFEFVDIAIPDIYKSNLKSTYEEETLEEFVTILNKEGKEITGKLRITLPITDGCKIVKLELTENILQETDITTDFLVEYANGSNLKSTKNVADCFETCDGRNREGWCKFWCVVEVLTSVV